MAKEPKNDNENVEVPLKVLTELQEKMAELERKNAEIEAKNAGMEELFAAQGDKKEEKGLREKKTFEPKFRTLRIRKYPIAGDHNNLGYIVGWTNRGAYEEVDKSGVSAQIVNFLDVFFLDHERDEKGKLQAQKVPILGHDGFLHAGIPVHCKIIDTRINPEKVPTGEEIGVSVFDPQHGMVSTGDVIDGWTAYSHRSYLIEIPGRKEPVWIDEEFVNK